MKIVFMGTPDFAVPSLKALVEAGYDVAAVVTQPDKPKGRGKSLLPTPVKEEALLHEIPVYQPQPLDRSFPGMCWNCRNMAALIFMHHFYRNTEELPPSSRL